MHKDDFARKVVGTQYINRGHDYDGMDCYGLVYLYFRDVLGVVTDLTDEYLNGDDFTIAFQAQLESGGWVKTDSPEGGEVVFMMYDDNGIPKHCGVMFDSKTCLHAHGSDAVGQVTLWPMRKVEAYIKRIYGINHKPRLEFYKWQS